MRHNPKIMTREERGRVQVYRSLLFGYLGYGLSGIAGLLSGGLSPQGFVLWAISVVGFGAALVTFALWSVGLLRSPANIPLRATGKPFRSFHLPG